MNKNEQLIKDYFKEYINGFIISDIQKCIDCDANFVIALSLMSYTEHLGGLLTGNLGVDGKSKENFNRGLEYFEFNGDSNYYKEFEVKDNATGKTLNIYKVFRCGLVHEYFPKGIKKLLIHNEKSYTPLTDVGVSWIDIDGERRLRFHCNAYFRDFKNAFRKYYYDLLNKKDPVLQANFMKAISNLEVYDISEII